MVDLPNLQRCPVCLCGALHQSLKHDQNMLDAALLYILTELKSRRIYIKPDNNFFVTLNYVLYKTTPGLV